MIKMERGFFRQRFKVCFIELDYFILFIYMDLKIYKINNGYKIGKKDGSRLSDKFGNRYYITKRPMRRDTAKRMLMKIQLEEQGYKMRVHSKKKKFSDGFMRVVEKQSRKARRVEILCPELDEFLIYL
jgi:hypothetical protein|tara:strand:- start:4016 stop:4399 length:384 start_codon:yes stop_codon:yes gene_type:complete